MTMDASILEELERMSNPQHVEEAVQQQGRPFNKPKYLEFIADIGDIVGPYDVQPTGNQQFGYRAIKLPFRNMTILQAEEALQIVGDDYEVRVPAKESEHAELYLMVKSAMRFSPDVNSIVKFPGLKKVHFKESVHTYPSRRPTDEDRKDDKTGLVMRDKDGKPLKVWKDVTANTYYYEVIGIGDIGASATASQTVASNEAVEAALKLITEDGVEEATFKGQALRDPIIQKDATLGPAISNGKWITDMIEQGKVLREGDKLMKVK